MFGSRNTGKLENMKNRFGQKVLVSIALKIEFYFPQSIPIGHGCPKKGTKFKGPMFTPTPPKYNVEGMPIVVRLTLKNNQSDQHCISGAWGVDGVAPRSRDLHQHFVPFLDRGVGYRSDNNVIE